MRNLYSPEVLERAVRLALTSESEYPARWAVIKSISVKIGCTPETLRSWVNKVQVDSGTKPGITTDQTQRTKELERENRELKQN